MLKAVLSKGFIVFTPNEEFCGYNLLMSISALLFSIQTRVVLTASVSIKSPMFWTLLEMIHWVLSERCLLLLLLSTRFSSCRRIKI